VSTPGTEDKVFANKESPEIDLRYETVPELPPPPPAVEEEEDQFGLADQIRATPERNMRGKKNKKNRRSHEIHEEALSAEAEEVPPPLPPKKLSPSPTKGKSFDKQPSEEEEVEAVPVKNKFRSLGEEASPHPLPPRRERQSASNEPREITEQMSPEKIQSRPLPAPPAPPRNMKKKSASIEESEGRGSRNSDRSYGEVTATENYRTCAESFNTSKTLRGNSSKEEDDITLAESVVDSLVSCAETLVGENENLETCVDTLTGGDTEFFSDDDDNPYPSVNFDRAGASIVEEEREGRSLAKKREVQKSESGRRLEEGTQQLSMELMQHVESLKTTLDNMSNRLGTRSRSRSHSKTRASYKDSL